MIYALDIETAPRQSLPDTKWIRKNKADLALFPQYSTITKIGVVGEDEQYVFNKPYEFQEWLEHSGPDTKFVLQKFSFDLWHLYYHGVDISTDSVIGDTQILYHVLPIKVDKEWLKKYDKKRVKLNADLPHGVSHREGTPLSLKTLAPYFLGVDPFWENPADHANDEYVLKDCAYTRKLYFKGLELCKTYTCRDFYERELAAAKMLYRMKKRGMNLDLFKLEELKKEDEKTTERLSVKIDEMLADTSKQLLLEETKKLKSKYKLMSEKAIAKLKDSSKEASTSERYNKLFEAACKTLPDKVDVASDKQLLAALKLQGFDCRDFKGKEGTGKEVLQGILNATGSELVQAILDFRVASKRVTSYYPSYEALQIDGTLHPDWNITGTRTGRLSSSKPNLQQVSPHMKQVFSAPKGYKYLSFDAEAIEAKLIAVYSNDKALFDIVAAGDSIHDYRTKYVFFKDISPEIAECDIKDIKKRFPKQRDATKEVGFARFYGSGRDLIKGSLQKHGFPVSDGEAHVMWERDREFFSQATSFHLAVTDAFKQGAIIQNLCGRPISIPSPSDCYMKGFNTLIQSSASDLNLFACMEAEALCLEQGLDAYPVALVHDEILFLVKEDIVDRVKEILIGCMTGVLPTAHGDIPLTVSGGVYDVWQK